LTDKNIIVSGDKSIESTDRITVLMKHPKKFFELWDTYMYIHDGKYFEPRCRLLMESYYYNKNIIYESESLETEKGIKQSLFKNKTAQGRYRIFQNEFDSASRQNK